MFYKIIYFIPADAVQSLTTGTSMWIAVSTTGVVVFIAGLLAGVLVYHCIIKHQSPNSKPRSSSCQQHQTVPSSNQLQKTGPESEVEVELEQNPAYPFHSPNRHWNESKWSSYNSDLLLMTNCKLLHNCITIIVCAEYQKSQNYSVFPESHYNFYIQLLLKSQIIFVPSPYVFCTYSTITYLSFSDFTVTMLILSAVYCPPIVYMQWHTALWMLHKKLLYTVLI